MDIRGGVVTRSRWIPLARRVICVEYADKRQWNDTCSSQHSTWRLVVVMDMGNALLNFNSDRELLYMGEYDPRRVGQMQPQHGRSRPTLYEDFCREIHYTCILHEKCQKIILFGMHRE